MCWPRTGYEGDVKPGLIECTLTSRRHACYGGLGHGDDGTTHNLTTIESAIRCIGLLESIASRDRLRSAYLPTRRQGQDIRHIGTHTATIRTNNVDAAPHQPGNLDTSGGGTRSNADHHHAS